MSTAIDYNPASFLIKHSHFLSGSFVQKLRDVFRLFFGLDHYLKVNYEKTTYRAGLLDYIPFCGIIIFFHKFTSREERQPIEEIPIQVLCTIFIYIPIQIAKVIIAAALTLIASPFVLIAHVISSFITDFKGDLREQARKEVPLLATYDKISVFRKLIAEEDNPGLHIIKSNTQHEYHNYQGNPLCNNAPLSTSQKDALRALDLLEEPPKDYVARV